MARHRRDKSFFSAATQSDNHCSAVAKDAPNPGLRNKAREAVEVVQLLEFGHDKSMTRIPPEGKSTFPGNYAVLSSIMAESRPLENAKSLISKERAAFNKANPEAEQPV